MSRRALCFLENGKMDHAARSVLEWAAFLKDSCGFDICIFLWEMEESGFEFPEPLETVQWFCLDEFPPLMQMSTLDLADLAERLQNRFPADLMLVPAFVSVSPLHLLGAAFACMRQGDFWFGVSECIPRTEGTFACRRTLAGNVLESVPAYPLAMAIAHHRGIAPHAWKTGVSPQKLPLSGFDLDVDMLQMRSAVFPEPVSILQAPEPETVSLDEALAFLVAENAEK